VIDRPLLLVHGFYQLVAAAALLAAAASYASRHDESAPRTGAWPRALLAFAAAVAAGVLAGAPWRAAIDGVLGLLHVDVAALVPADDQQGAFALLPAYQLALTAGLWVALTGGRRPRTLAWWIGALASSQLLFVVALAGVHGWFGVAAHALVIRGWAVAVPSALALAWTLRTRTQSDRDLAMSGDAADRYAAGIEYVVDARGCDPALLQSIDRLQRISADVVRALALRTVAPPLWHRRPEDSGVAGLLLLSESHLSIHTYPDAGLAVINLYCCRRQADWPWESGLATALGAGRVSVRSFPRGHERPE